jgi:hypothetical protein
MQPLIRLFVHTDCALMNFINIKNENYDTAIKVCNSENRNW